MGSPQGSMVACLAWGKVDALPMVDILIDMDHDGELLGAEVSYDLSSNREMIPQIQVLSHSKKEKAKHESIVYAGRQKRVQIQHACAIITR